MAWQLLLLGRGRGVYSFATRLEICDQGGRQVQKK